ncbi:MULTISPECIES: extracellular solute-binding protein [unclassified Tatumella]|uniref:extracellular solute-binding protein n=1 Tax=unclassified Tatumella TaxID=2649542 RepID=UPI001BAEEA40|nr:MULTISPECIES: extracellular solute-binding protein [unclassified Tatumella]MBS0857110.1 extracellular solute-binding protein [Tatumella sp. JGM16]MBS0878478.1 extracellular solute-binding protein [Tatumella sp. JGM82]MBS0891989.1 extracellular solute-binding protein [Tatumella sp. JGM94]MBS0894713.1 extracellular solute-binding protein [Tatumella sp. JGM130]MBS0903107.1 extracellular solute-binding protein [Tatumella sp. JGM100]
MSRGLCTILVALSVSMPVLASDNIRVTYAGSMGKVMDQELGPAFASQQKGTYQGQGQGAYGMARLLASHKIEADVFVSITPGPMQILKDAGLIETAVPVASTSMVIAYNPKSKYAAQFAEAGTRHDGSWLQVMTTPGLQFGRTDPYLDPKGQNIVFSLLLAEKYYRQPGIAEQIMGSPQNPRQVHLEGGLLTRLESGQIDAAAGYESEVISAGLPYLSFPDQINLSNPQMEQQWYNTVSFTIKDSKGQDKVLHTQPLVYYAAVLKNAPNGVARGQKFVDFMLTPQGQKLFRDSGYSAPKGKGLYQQQ